MTSQTSSVGQTASPPGSLPDATIVEILRHRVRELGPRLALRGCVGGDKSLNLEAPATDPDVRAEIEASLHRVNATLSHVETVKEWRIPRDFTIAAGEVTPR